MSFFATGKPLSSSFFGFSVVSGPAKFDTDTLESALRIATVFDYPGLRKFAISGLEKATLAPIDRIRLSDELLLPQWEKLAFAELCQRKDAVSLSEAQVLGIERFTQIARIREAEQCRRFLSNCLPKGLQSKLDSGVLICYLLRPNGNTVQSPLR